jgi:hypothetical protein
MSMMGELTFFLDIQVKQMKQGTFVHQAKYMKDLIKKFVMADAKPVSTPMSMTTALDPDEEGETVDQREYMSMIGSLLYLTVTQLDIQFIVCLCARFQAFLHTLHHQAVQRIFRYLKQTLEFRIWYSTSSLLLLLCYILLAFQMLILWIVELIKKALLVHVTFLDLLSYVGLLTNNLLLLNPPQRLSM